LLDVDLTKQKVRSVLAQLKRLQADDFPYTEPRDSLTLIESLFKDDLARLEAIDDGTDVNVRRQACAHANHRVALYHPVLGFILRSTNVRNAFEAYDPLLQICRRIYGEQAKLILSSEWSFSPFTYPAVFKDLPDLMFIGMPATEAGNALILPLAGHELGHSVWRRPVVRGPSVAQPLLLELQTALVEQYRANWLEFQKAFDVTEPPDQILANLFLRSIWSQSYRLAERQLEELFCDVLGLAIFGESFLYAFIYVLTPNLGDRVPHYPALSRRIETLERASQKLSIEVPKDFASYFSEMSSAKSARDAFVLRMADNACGACLKNMIDVADNHVRSSGVMRPQQVERDRIAKHFAAFLLLRTLDVSRTS
jgi:hypothetical protein